MTNILFDAIFEFLVSMVFVSFLIGISSIFRRFFKKRIDTKQETYSDKILKLTETLTKSSEEVDNIVRELTLIGQERSTSVAKLEQQLEELSTREQQAKDRIQTLEKVPVEAVKYFEQILAKEDKRSAWRDYTLFGLGVLVSTVITILLQYFGI